MIGFTPSEEQEALRDTARGFARRSIRPLVGRVHCEGIEGGTWDLVRPVVEEGVKLGFTHMLVPEDAGGPGLSCLDAVIVLEEIGAADVAIAADYFALTAVMPLMPLRAGRPDGGRPFVERFLAAPAMMLAGAQSEPNVAGSELMMAGPDAAFGPKLSAQRDGDGWVLNGSKSAFVTNAGVADHYFIIARTDPDKPVFEGLTVFDLPAGTPGLSVGRNTELIGWPLSHHAPLSFDSVRVSDDQRISKVGGAAMLFARLPEMGACLAACFVGLARASLEYALAYAKERHSLGRPIAQHQAVALKLAEMASELHAARLMVWEAASACATDPMRAAMFSGPAATAKAVDVAIRNAQLCMEILGGYGVTREYEAGRFFNDALVGYSCDFTREILHLGIAQGLCDAP